MKKHIFGITIFLFVCIILWVSATPEPQIHSQSNLQLKKNEQKINTLLLRIQKLEKELKQLKNVIRIKGNNVEIISPLSLKLRANSLDLKSNTKMNFNSTVNMLFNSSFTSINSKGTIKLKGSKIFLN